MQKEVIFLFHWYETFIPNLLKSSYKGRFAIKLSLLLIMGCSKVGDEISSISITSEEVQLKENLLTISPIANFHVLEDGSIVVITESNQIIRYSNTGEQKKILKNYGQGSLELYSPSIVQAYKDGYVIWDKSLLKMVEFDQNDQAVLEFMGFNHAIKDFMVDENYFFTYINPLPNKPFIQVFDKKNGALAHELGVAGNADIFGNLNRCAGGMTFLDNDLLFVSSSSLDVFRVNKDRIEDIKLYLIEDKTIKFKVFEDDAENTINTDISKAIKWSMSTSIVTGIHNLGQNILIIGETGETKFDGEDLDLRNRKDFLLLLNKDLDIIGKSYQAFDLNSPCKLWADSGEKLYRIIRRESAEDYNYYLQKINIHHGY